jgi:hypothetical protein
MGGYTRLQHAHQLENVEEKSQNTEMNKVRKRYGRKQFEGITEMIRHMKMGEW